MSARRTARRVEHSEKPCAWCRIVPDYGCGYMASGNVSSDVVICRDCLVGAVASCCVSNDLLAELRTELRSTLQRELLEMREPTIMDPMTDGKPRTIGVTINQLTFDRIQALALEADIPLAAWVRQAIFLAFKSVSARLTVTGSTCHPSDP